MHLILPGLRIFIAQLVLPTNMAVFSHHWQCFSGTDGMAQWLKELAAFKKTEAQFPAPT